MTLDDVVQKANENSQESLTPKNYSMFIASKPVDSDRKWLDVTNKYTNDVGECNCDMILIFCVRKDVC